MPTRSLRKLFPTSINQTPKNTHMIHDVGFARLEINYILIKRYTRISGWCWIWQRGKSFAPQNSLWVLKISFLPNRFAQKLIFLNKSFTFFIFFMNLSCRLRFLICSHLQPLIYFTFAKLASFMFSWQLA